MKKPSLTYGNIVSTLALIIACGTGTAYAASVALNSIGSNHLINNSVKSADIQDGTIALADISAAAKKSLKGATGARGPVGPQGPRGLQGIQGVPGAAGVPGANGAAIAVTASGTSVVAVPPDSEVGYALAPANWTQGANESDIFNIGYSYVAPASCTGDGAGFWIAFFVDGNWEASVFEPWPGQSGPFYNTAIAPQFLEATGTADARTLSIQVYNGCTGGGETFTMNSMRVYVQRLV